MEQVDKNKLKNHTTEDLETFTDEDLTITNPPFGFIGRKCVHCDAHLYVSDNTLVCLNACYVKPRLDYLKGLFARIDIEFADEDEADG